MRRLPAHRLVAVVALGFVLLPGFTARASARQEDASPIAILLSRARTLEQRGRLDLAKQDWQQVLTADPNDAEALAGLARAARAEGKTAEAAGYAGRLRAAHPHDPALAQLQTGAQERNEASDLAEAARLARAGDYGGVMAIYRRVYGVNPPPGEAALAYYEAEGATEEGRPAAIAGLRAMADRFPAVARYQIALGRLLVVSPRTRAEGRTLLEQFPQDGEAAAALQEGGGSGEQGAAVKAATELAARGAEVHPGAAGERVRGVAEVPARPAQVASNQPRSLMHTASAATSGPMHRVSDSAADQAAYAALDGHRTAEAEQRFRDVLVRNPMDARALAGMGYVQVTTGDLKTAILFFERAQESGDRSLALTRALVNAEYELALEQAAGARAKGNLAGAETQYKTALRERPSDPDALEGLGSTLLEAGRAEDAIPVFTKLTQMRPLSPGAWRGLVLAEAAGGHVGAIASTVARVPPEASEPLQGDAAYQLTIAAAKRRQGTQVARVETPPVVMRPPVVAPPARSAAEPAARPATVEHSTPADRASGAVAEPVTPRRASAMAAVPEEGVVSPPPPAPRKSGGRSHSRVPVVPPASLPPAPVVAVTPAAPVTPPPNVAIADERVRQAEFALRHGSNAEAAVLFRDALGREPERAEAWRGLVEALHNGGQDAEAARAMLETPASARPVLERDASFEAVVGAVYLEREEPQEALRAFARAQDVFASQRLAPPLPLVLQIARLLAARGDDDNLYRELMYVGERTDLTAAQRQEVQMVWTGWAVRRARALAEAGDRRRAVTLLNAAAQAFSGNVSVVRAIAEGYSGIGLSREAVALYKTQDLATAPARDVEAAVVSATEARDFRDAGNWARLGLQRFGNDPEMLTVAAELEQARGHENRALGLTQQAKAVAPPQNPGQVLAAELKEAKAGQGWAPGVGVAGQLSVLLAPSEAAALASGPGGALPYVPESASAPAGGGRASGQTPVLSSYEEPSR